MSRRIEQWSFEEMRFDEESGGKKHFTKVIVRVLWMLCGFEVLLLRRISSIGRRCALTKKAAPKTFAKVVCGTRAF